jgi:serine/threonine protein kinase
MTYFVGESLEKMILSNDKKENEINNWIISSINILEKIHLYGIIHRDIKPAHFIFVKEKQKWVLIDFGFATYYTESKIEFEKENEFIIGTPNYISINIHNGFKPKPIDDIWSIIYIYIRYMFPELFIFSYLSLSKKEEIYPSNHILNNQNQCRKEKKELINQLDFWDKTDINKEKIVELINIIQKSTTKNIYNNIRFLFSYNKKQYKNDTIK